MHSFIFYSLSQHVDISEIKLRHHKYAIEHGYADVHDSKSLDLRPVVLRSRNFYNTGRWSSS